jgi:hypothetical protein
MPNRTEVLTLLRGGLYAVPVKHLTNCEAQQLGVFREVHFTEIPEHRCDDQQIEGVASDIRYK